MNPFFLLKVVTSSTLHGGATKGKKVKKLAAAFGGHLRARRSALLGASDCECLTVTPLRDTGRGPPTRDNRTGINDFVQT